MDVKVCLYLGKFNILREETNILKWEWVLKRGVNIKKCIYSVCIYVCVPEDLFFLSFSLPTAYLKKGTPIFYDFLFLCDYLHDYLKFDSNRENIFVYHIVVVVYVNAGKFKERRFGISVTQLNSKETDEWVEMLEGSSDARFEGPFRLLYRFVLNRPLEKHVKRILGKLNLRCVWRCDWWRERMALGPRRNIYYWWNQKISVNLDEMLVSAYYVIILPKL